MDNIRNTMPTQLPDNRTRNFDEVALGFTQSIAMDEASRCLRCKNAPCMLGCPVGVKIPDFIQKILQNDIDGANAIIEEDNNLPRICGRVCPQESQCERNCVRGAKLGGAVSIGALERYVADNASRAVASNAVARNPQNQVSNPMKNAKVAVVGSGPAGLSCAFTLAKAGVSVTIYEALNKAGGVLLYGIPEFRLPKSILDEEVSKLTALGVEIVTDVVVGKTVFLEGLRDRYDAVFVGSGAGLPMFLKIKGENLCGVYSANEYLTRVNLMKAYDVNSVTPIHRGKKVVVIGAGNVAMDAARTALRLGAEVTLVYRRGREEMPARKEEILHAEEEGVAFTLLSNPVEILGENGFVTAIKCVKMSLGEPDESGRRSPKPIPDSEFTIDCDEVIVALGTTPNPIIRNSEPNLEYGKKGVILADENGKTNLDGVYVGGDAMTGAATVILAMGAGKKSAIAILKELQKADF